MILRTSYEIFAHIAHTRDGHRLAPVYIRRDEWSEAPNVFSSYEAGLEHYSGWSIVDHQGYSSTTHDIIIYTHTRKRRLISSPRDRQFRYLSAVETTRKFFSRDAQAGVGWSAGRN